MDSQKLPISEDGKRLAAFFEAKMKEMKEEIIAEIKSKPAKTTSKK